MRSPIHLFLLCSLALVFQGFIFTNGLGILTKDVHEAYPGEDTTLYCDYREGPDERAISTVAVDWAKADSNVEHGWKLLCRARHNPIEENSVLESFISPQKYILNPDVSGYSLGIRNITKADESIYRCLIVITTSTGMESTANSTVELKVVTQNRNEEVDDGANRGAPFLPSLVITFALSFLPLFLLPW